MNYFIPPQGGGLPAAMYAQPQLAGLQQMQVNPSLAPQMNLLNGGSPSPQLHMLAPGMGLASAPQFAQQPALMQPRLVQAAPVAQHAQLSQARYAAAVAQVSQMQAVQAARQQAAAQRAITSLAVSGSSVVRTTPPHHHSHSHHSYSSYSSYHNNKKETTDAAVQTPEADVNPEADSSTKNKILNLTLASCSGIVSTQYHHLQSRILTWGDKQERQALEVTRVKSDVGTSALITTPTTFAAVVIFDDGTLQFCVRGKVLKSTQVTGSEDMDDRELREYLDNLGELYTYCCGFSEADLNQLCMNTLHRRYNLLIRVAEPYPHAISPSCAKWCKVAEGVSTAEVRCPACVSALKKLKRVSKGGDLIMNTAAKKRKRQVHVTLSDIPTEPLAKKPKVSVSTLMQEIGLLQQQVTKFHSSEASENPMVVGKFLTHLGLDLNRVKEAVEENCSDDEVIDGEDALLENDDDDDETPAPAEETTTVEENDAVDTNALDAVEEEEVCQSGVENDTTEVNSLPTELEENDMSEIQENEVEEQNDVTSENEVIEEEENLVNGTEVEENNYGVEEEEEGNIENDMGNGEMESETATKSIVEAVATTENNEEQIIEDSSI